MEGKNQARSTCYGQKLGVKHKKGWRSHMENFFSKVERFAENVADWMTIIVTSKMMAEWIVERGPF